MTAKKVSRVQAALERRRNEYRLWEAEYQSASDPNSKTITRSPEYCLRKMRIADQDIRNMERKLGMTVSNHFQKTYGKSK